MNTTVADNKTRKKLLSDFNKKFKVHVKSQHSGNGLTDKHIENAIKTEYKPCEYTSNIKAKYKELQEELANKAFDAYNAQNSNIDKLNVYVTYGAMGERVKKLTHRNGNYYSANTAYEINNRSLYTLEAYSEAQDEIAERFTELYTDSYEGQKQMLLDIGKMYSGILLEIGKEREKYYQYFDENDPLRLPHTALRSGRGSGNGAVSPPALPRTWVILHLSL